MPQRRKLLDSENRILSASLEVLQSAGAAGFSTPEVARRAKLRQSHITYYFPTRKKLLLATTNFALKRYEHEFQIRLLGLEKFSLKKSKEFLDWLFTDAIDSQTVRTFPELWSLANVDDDIANAVKNLYIRAACSVVETLGLDPKNPKNHKLLELLILIGSVSEGITAIHGHRQLIDPIFVNHKNQAIQIFAPKLFNEYKKAIQGSRRERSKAHKK